MQNNDKPSVAYTLRHDLCCGCGICEDSCPHNSISIVTKQGYFIPQIDSTKCRNNRGCHRCYDACSGHGINLQGMSKTLFTDDETKENALAGRYLRCFTGYSNDYDIRYHSASGGMVSQFLIWLLEKNKIDGAVVTKFDNKEPLMVRTYIATTKEDVLDARSSKYGPVTMAGMAKAIKEASGSRYVVVGLPCHIQGFRKLMAIDKRLRDKVVGLFAIYCSSGRSFHLTEHVMNERGIKRDELRYFAYRDEGCLGSMVAITEKGAEGDDAGIRIFNRNSETYLSKGVKQIYKDRYQNFYHPLRSFFIPRRCLFCIDHYGELGDISFGDIHIKPYIDDKVGVNSLIVRSRVWLDYLLDAQKDRYVSLDEVAFDTVSASQKMSFKKKGRNGAFINLNKKLGRAVPKYDVDYLRQPTMYDIIDWYQNRFQQFLGCHRSLWWLVSKLKAKVRIH